MKGIIAAPSAGFPVNSVGVINSKINFDYKIDLIKEKAYKRNQVNIVSKILSKSSKAQKKYDITV